MGNGKRKNYISGPKFCRHGGVTEPARRVAEVVSKYTEVRKISNGDICGRGPSQFGIRFIQINGGWTIKVYGAHAVQDLHVYTNDPPSTREKLELKFPFNLR